MDVALAISALEVAFTNRIDLIVLVTGDADFVPLVWALKRRGVRVVVLGFQYKHPTDDSKCSFIATALRNAAHFCVDVAELERSAPHVFGSLFPGRARLESSRPPRGNGRTSVGDNGEEHDVDS